MPRIICYNKNTRKRRKAYGKQRNFASRGGASLLARFNKGLDELLPRPQGVGGKAVSEAHSKELNVLTSYRLNDFKKKAAFTLAEGATHVDMSDNIRRVAFTLAEVLITLGIIGIVAAMTIPTLISKYTEKQTVTHLIKVYTTLSNAFQMVNAEYGPISTWGLKNTTSVDENDEVVYDHSAQKIVAERIKPYLKISRQCVIGEICYPSSSYTLSGQRLGDPSPLSEESDSSPEGSFFLSDGTYINIGWYGLKRIDIGIVLKPDQNILGKTKFFFTYTDKGLIPEGMKNPLNEYATFEQHCDPSKTFKESGRGCTAWVIYNKNMDYLYCRDELSWDGKHSCDE